MIKATLVLAVLLTGAGAQAMETTCYNETFGITAKVSITKKTAHSISGDYEYLNFKMTTNSPSFPKGSGKTWGRLSDYKGGPLYFRDTAGVLTAFVSESVYTTGNGKFSYIKSGKNKGYKRWSYVCRR